MLLKIVVVDDEPFIRDELKYFLEKDEDVEIVGETGYGDEVIDIVKAHMPDVIFLDIELQYTNGITIARQLRELNKPPAIVLATAYDKYAVLGYEMDVIDYILKPFSALRIEKTLDKIRSRSNEKGTHEGAGLGKIGKLCVSKKDKLYLKSFDEIVFFEAKNKSVRVVCEGEEYSCQYTLKDLETLLLSESFTRIHKSFIVNLDHIEEIVPWFNYTLKLKMRGYEDEVLVNRSYIKTFKALLSI